MAYGFKTGGRKKGSKNRVNRDVQALLDKVFSRVNPEKKLEELLNSDDPRISGTVLIKLLEYRYGKPQEKLQLTGGRVDIYDVVREARERANRAIDERAARLAEAESAMPEDARKELIAARARVEAFEQTANRWVPQPAPEPTRPQLPAPPIDPEPTIEPPQWVDSVPPAPTVIDGDDDAGHRRALENAYPIALRAKMQ